MKNEENIYLGLDIGTDSVGYAVTDDKYKIMKYHGNAAWGSTILTQEHWEQTEECFVPQEEG